jgi:hypothetical protein
MMIELLYRHFMNHPEQLPADLLRINQERSEPIERAVVDYIAGYDRPFCAEGVQRPVRAAHLEHIGRDAP